MPYGLVRFGVAPDHPEVKNVINTLSKTAENPSSSFFGNVSLEIDVTLRQLQENYHTVLLAYGADEDRKLNIPNENIETALPAREFVAWYNGLPEAENLSPNLDRENVAIIGRGNVAIDVARILLSSLDTYEDPVEDPNNTANLDKTQAFNDDRNLDNASNKSKEHSKSSDESRVNETRDDPNNTHALK